MSCSIIQSNAYISQKKHSYYLFCVYYIISVIGITSLFLNFGSNMYKDSQSFLGQWHVYSF